MKNWEKFIVDRYKNIIGTKNAKIKCQLRNTFCIDCQWLSKIYIFLVRIHKDLGFTNNIKK